MSQVFSWAFNVKISFCLHRWRGRALWSRPTTWACTRSCGRASRPPCVALPLRRRAPKRPPRPPRVPEEALQTLLHQLLPPAPCTRISCRWEPPRTFLSNDFLMSLFTRAGLCRLHQRVGQSCRILVCQGQSFYTLTGSFQDCGVCGLYTALETVKIYDAVRRSGMRALTGFGPLLRLPSVSQICLSLWECVCRRSSGCTESGWRTAACWWRTTRGSARQPPSSPSSRASGTL